MSTRFDIYTDSIARPDHQTQQAMQLILGKGGEAFLRPAPSISARGLKQKTKPPQFFCGDRHIGNFNSLKKFLTKWRPPKRTTHDIPAQETNASALRHAWDKLDCGIVLHLVDGTRKYWAVDERGVNNLIFSTRSERDQNRSNRTDCHSPAIQFASSANQRGLNTVAILYDISSRHLYNVIFYKKDNEVVARAFEPETDQFVELGKGRYKAHAGVVMMP